MLSDSKTEALKRLSYIEGHLSGIRKMVAQVRLAQCPVTRDAVAHRVSHSVKPAR